MGEGQVGQDGSHGAQTARRDVVEAQLVDDERSVTAGSGACLSEHLDDLGHAESATPDNDQLHA